MAFLGIFACTILSSSFLSLYLAIRSEFRLQFMNMESAMIWLIGRLFHIQFFSPCVELIVSISNLFLILFFCLMEVSISFKCLDVCWVSSPSCEGEVRHIVHGYYVLTLALLRPLVVLACPVHPTAPLPTLLHRLRPSALLL